MWDRKIYKQLVSRSLEEQRPSVQGKLTLRASGCLGSISGLIRRCQSLLQIIATSMRGSVKIVLRDSRVWQEPGQTRALRITNLFTPSYLLALPAAVSTVPGIASMKRSKSGLQKYAMLYRAGCIAAEIFGSTTRCLVLRIVSLDQRARRSPAFTTIVSGIGVAST
jgi:hypothetical protein